ncbi:hypothetical protein PG987_001036 [Apiospora arundinis]
MCRRTIHHYMYHDVRIPMALDVDAPLYVNPLRTTPHVCDINIGRAMESMGIFIEDDDEDTDSTAPRYCEYHSCCVSRNVVTLCPLALRSRPSAFRRPPPASYLSLTAGTSHADASDDLPEPEECAGFTLEHRHMPLNAPKLVSNQWVRITGQSSEQARNEARRQQPPAEEPMWRELKEIVPGRDWIPVFRRDPDQYLRWTAWMFDKMAELAVFRDNDARAQEELRRGGFAAGFAAVDRMATSAANVRALEKFLQNEFKWAASPPH